MKSVVITLTFLLVLTGCMSGFWLTNNSTAEVYIPSGRLQCQSVGRPLNATQAELDSYDIRVTDSKCAQISGEFYAASCFIPSGEIHVHQIAASDLEKAETKGFLSVTRLKEGYQEKECPVSYE